VREDRKLRELTIRDNVRQVLFRPCSIVFSSHNKFVRILCTHYFSHTNTRYTLLLRTYSQVSVSYTVYSVEEVRKHFQKRRKTERQTQKWPARVYVFFCGRGKAGGDMGCLRQTQEQAAGSRRGEAESSGGAASWAPGRVEESEARWGPRVPLLSSPTASPSLARCCRCSRAGGAGRDTGSIAPRPVDTVAAAPRRPPQQGREREGEGVVRARALCAQRAGGAAGGGSPQPSPNAAPALNSL
jgi:hypothetical protein